MSQTEKFVPIEEAEEQVRRALVRLGLLHLAFARTLVDELGEEKGKALILKSIADYGIRIGERGKAKVLSQGKDPKSEPFPADLPTFGLQSTPGQKLELGEGEVSHSLGFGCVMSEVWREYGESELGRLYCYVDPLKSLSYNSDTVHFHARVGEIEDGKWICEHITRYTDEAERAAYENRENSDEWKNIEPWYGDVTIPSERGVYKPSNPEAKEGA